MPVVPPSDRMAVCSEPIDHSPPLERFAIDQRSFRSELEARNALRREGGLPVLDVDAGLQRWVDNEVGVAKESFMAEYLAPHTEHLDKRLQEITSHMSALALSGSYRRIFEQHQPDMDKAWESMLADGSWAAYR